MKFKSWIFLFFSSLSLLLSGQSSFKNSSILKSGTWYKIKIENSSVYKLTSNDLLSIGINTPENIRVYGQSGKQLSFTNDSNFDDDLVEIPLCKVGNDYLFYGDGVESIYFDDNDSIFRQRIHNYALYNYYYITSSFGPGKRVEEVNTGSLVSNFSQTTYDIVDYYEKENKNLIQSGRQFYSDEFSGGLFEKEFELSNIILSDPVFIASSIAVRSGNSKTVRINANGTPVSTLSFPSVNIDNHEGIFAKNSTSIGEFISSSDQIKVSVSFAGNGSSDKAFLDYLTLNARGNLIINSVDDAFFFRDIKSVGEGFVTNFIISGANESTQIWNITDVNEPYQVTATLSGSSLSFKTETNLLQEFVAVNTNGNFPPPIYIDDNLGDVGGITTQNIHNSATPELLIVTHPAFKVQAEELAELHRDKDDMSVLVLTTTQVYNEFSSGKPDASAIRNMARMFYERSNDQISLKYLLLFGDGSYDNRTINNINPNYIPTYQSINSLSHTGSYVSDDFYAILDPGKQGVYGDICIGVGRIPVNSDGNSEVEAQGVVNKIKEYYDAKNMKDWRNNMIFLGDDGESGWDDTVFMTDSDKLTTIVGIDAPSMNFNKVYLDAYAQISSSTGAAYPEAEESLKEAFRKGALVFNYMGHGGETGITQEQVLTKSDFENLTNAPYFPLFVTATCQLSRYDNVDVKGSKWAKKVSAGEAAFLNPNGGAIAMLTTTRLVYQSSNMVLSETLYKNLFKKDSNGDRYRLGDIIRIAKNTTLATRENTLKFALLGDPAITLGYGEYTVITDSIDSRAISVSDTINALNEVSVCGYVAYSDSSKIDDFNGTVYVSVFDKAYTVTSNGNDNTATIDFQLQDKLLFRGKASVSNGRFKVIFMVPKDISYSFGNGKISYYAENGIIDAKGSFDSFIVGGTAESPEIDMDGPEITLFMNNKNFIDGGITDANPVLVAEIFDASGINTTGNGIGHNLIGILDNDLSKSYLLNDYFEGDTDNYRKGLLSYQLNELEEGHHTITFKVWDTYNNSSEEIINFYVNSSGSLTITELLNYPNPASTYTNFQYSHNNSDSEHEINIDIYDISGRIIHSINRTFNETGYVSDPIYFDFTSVNGNNLKPGVYPYRLTVRTSDGIEGNENGNLIIIP